MPSETHTQPTATAVRGETDDDGGGGRLLPPPPRPRGEREVVLGAMVSTNVRCYPELIAQLKAYCAFTGDSQNTVFNEALRHFLGLHVSEIVRGFQIKEMEHDAERRMLEESLPGPR